MTVESSVASKHYRQKVVPFHTEDGLTLNLINVRGHQTPDKCPVLLVHGAGVRANIFRAPVEVDIVDALIAEGYDVWLENWRASIDFNARQWTLDQAARYDHPAAVKAITEQTGYANIKAIIHCQGSTSFAMSAVAGLVPQVSVIISNGVLLHPVVPKWSNFKMSVLLPMVKRLTDYLNPQWGIEAPTLTAKIISWFIRLTHHECDNDVCKQISFTYGSGFPALWNHENLNHQTHQWLSDEFAAVPMSFFSQMAKCIQKGHLLSVQGLPGLPKDFVAGEPQTDARFAFFAGQDNLCFLPQSQINSYQYFNQIQPGKHSLHLIDNYSHLDVFMGKNAAQDTFPLMLAELAKAD